MYSGPRFREARPDRGDPVGESGYSLRRKRRPKPPENDLPKDLRNRLADWLAQCGPGNRSPGPCQPHPLKRAGKRPALIAKGGLRAR